MTSSRHSQHYHAASSQDLCYNAKYQAIGAISPLLGTTATLNQKPATFMPQYAFPIQAVFSSTQCGIIRTTLQVLV